MNIDLSGIRVVVCGGSRGIGRAIALAAAQSGASVSICARGREALQATLADLERTVSATASIRHHAATCDLAEQAEITRYVAEAATALGGIDVLVNNASGFGFGDDEESWASCINVDLLATVRASREAMPYLVKSGRGSIVNISSISGTTASTRTPAYGAVKAAVIQYTKSQAAALAKQGIRANCIAPGSIEFPGGTWEQRRTEMPELYQQVLSRIAFGRLGTAEEIGAVAVFLASPLASWVTGQIISVDGGQAL